MELFSLVDLLAVAYLKSHLQVVIAAGPPPSIGSPSGRTGTTEAERPRVDMIARGERDGKAAAATISANGSG